MSDTHILDEADVFPIRANALATTKPAGYLHAVNGLVGVIVDDIIGTGADFAVAAALGQSLTDGVGDGLGDMFIEGVFAHILQSGLAPAVMDPLYYDGTNNYLTTTNSGSLAGWVWPQSDGSATRDPASDDPSWMANAPAAQKVVYVKMVGHPKAPFA